MKRSKFIAASALAVAAGLCAPLATAQVALPEAVETAQLPTDAFAIGDLEAAQGALPPTLWDGSRAQTLDFLLSHAPSRPATPSIGQAMRRTLLSAGAKPQGADASLGGRKLLALARAGFVDEARNISSLATTGRSDLTVAEAEATIDLLNGDTDGACRRDAALNGGRNALFWVKLRTLCYARAEEIDAFDLTMNLLRERRALSSADEALLLLVATGETPKTIPPIETPLHYAALKASGLALNAGQLASADGGVLIAVARDEAVPAALRIEAAMRAIAMGVLEPGLLAALFRSAPFEVTDIAAAVDKAATAPGDPLTDALLYQSVEAMNAPEFIRDKAQRISLALSVADSFPRAYSLSLLYKDEIEALEGVLVAPEEAGRFAMAAMAAGDSVGAGRWLSAMIGVNGSVAALPEDLAGAFIDRVNLLALLDPQTASRIARSAGVSLLSTDMMTGSAPGHADPAVTARILEAAFDAVAGDKRGQAGLAAVAASAGSRAGGQVEAVVVSEGLSAAGMPELRRRYAFEQAWAASFGPVSGVGASVSEGAAPTAGATSDDQGFAPRVKPPKP